MAIKKYIGPNRLSEIFSYIKAELDKKVTAVSGKGLSSNDYTTTEKNKLAGISSGAEVNVQADWDVDNTSSDAYILNKPTTLAGYGITDAKIANGTITLGSNSITPLTQHQDISGKADKATTLAGYGITDAKIANGTITLGSNTITPLTQHQDISGKADKATTLAGYGITDAKIASGTITLGSNTITPLTSHQTVTNKGATLAWSSAVTVATIGSTDIKVSLPANPNTDTKVTSVGNHYAPAEDSTAQLDADASSSTAATWNSTSLVTGVTVKRDAKGHVTGLAVDSIKMPANPNTNTTYTFADGTNGFTVTPSGGTAQTVKVTPSITNNVTGSGTSGYLAKFNGANTITSGPQLGSSTTTYLRNDGSWATPPDTNTTYTIATGDSNGQIKVTPSSGSAYNVSVKGLGSNAYTSTTIPTKTSQLTNDSSFVTSSDTTKYKVIGYCSDYQRVVIALCEVTASASSGSSSHTSGNIVSIRGNGLVPEYISLFAFQDNYSAAKSCNYSLMGNFENTSTTLRSGEGFRACVFTYNSKNYAGLEFYQVQARTFYWYGEGDFTPFMVAYYNANTSAVLNTEINNSITHSTSNCQRRSINVDLATMATRPKGFSSQSDNFTWGNQTGTALTSWNDSTGGSLGFRRDNPTTGQVSMIIDGTVYVDEGRYSVIHSGNIGSQSVSYATSAGSVAWSNVSSKPTTISGYGITDAKIANGVITLGSNTITPLTTITSSQVTTALGYTPYNSTNPSGYITSSGSCASATKATQDGNGNTISSTYMKKGVDRVTAGQKSGTSLGVNATAEGSSTTASGRNSHAEGLSTVASEYYAHAEGYETTASGDASHAEGRSHETYPTIVTKATGMGSHAEGIGTLASGLASHAEGLADYSSSGSTLLSWRPTTASGDGSHAEGVGTEAYATASHAEGLYTTAAGQRSHAEGWYSTVTSTGVAAHAEGYVTVASGYYSHAEGRRTIAASTAQHVEGKYNVEDANDTYAHIIGGGSSTTRKNIFTVDWNGDVCAGRSNGLTNDTKLPTGADVLSYGFIRIGVKVTSVSYSTGRYADINVTQLTGKNILGILNVNGYGTRDNASYGIVNATPSSYIISVSIYTLSSGGTIPASTSAHNIQIWYYY